MSGAWLNFIIVVFTQLFLFLVYAYYEKKLSEIPMILGLGVLIAIVLGIPFDLIVGKFFGLHSFSLEFGIFFLIINSIFSYGLFASSILLLQNVQLSQFILWNILIISTYETTNILFPVWTWKFKLPHTEFLIILLIGYLAGAIFVVAISHILFERRFLFIDKLFKK
ncbi:MAG: hypothetical protein WCI91_03205 [Candidatus Nomurabacteria bacterium]